MQAKTKRRSLFMAIVTAFVAFVAAVLIIPTSTVKADAYYYADEPAEVALGDANVFTWTGSANEGLDKTQDITLPVSYQGFFGGTVGNGKKEGDDWNINTNYAFMMDFTETWTGSFMVALGHYDIAIHKEANKIVVGIGGGYGTVDSAAPGLSELTGMQKVNVIHRVIYSDSAKTTPVGMQWTVTVGETFSWSYDRLGTEHVSCKTAHAYYIRNNTGIALGFSLKVPVTYYYAENPTEQSYEAFFPNTKTWALDDAHPGNYFWEFDGKTDPKILSGNYYAVTESKANLNNPTGTRATNVTFWLDFSGNWGTLDSGEAGYFDFSFGFADVSIHKDVNMVKVNYGGKYAVQATDEMEGLSALTGMQKVNMIEKPIYADKAKTTVVGAQYVVKVGDLEWSYDWIGFNYSSTRQYMHIVKIEGGALFQGTIARVTEASISTAGDIGLNFKAKLHENTTAQQATFKREGKADIVVDGVKVNGLWVFTCPVAAKDYKEVVTLEFTTASGESCSKSYSVEQYSKDLPQESPAYSLVTKLIAYCEAARAFFAGETLAATEALTTEQVEALTAGTLTGSQEGVEIKAATIVLETKTAIHIYFRAESVEGLVCKANGVEVAPVKVEGEENLYLVKVDNIASQDLADLNTIEIGGYTATYSVYSYVKAVMEANTNANLVEVVKALYFVGEAAADFFA